MIDINLENMKDVETRRIHRDLIVIILTDSNGSKIEITTTPENGEIIHDSLESACVEPTYTYEEMQRQLDEAYERIDDLEELLISSGMEEVV